MAEERSRLGRGLASLIGDMGAEASAQPERGRGARKAPVEHLRPNTRNPRSQFSDAELEELANSIRERGIIQPIVVRSVRGLGLLLALAWWGWTRGGLALLQTGMSC